MMVEDEVAQKLEAAGLWRRAASRWLDVMQYQGWRISNVTEYVSTENIVFPA